MSSGSIVSMKSSKSLSGDVKLSGKLAIIGFIILEASNRLGVMSLDPPSATLLDLAARVPVVLVCASFLRLRSD